MARAFATISFTPNVQKVQTEMGSRHNYQSFVQGNVEEVLLSEFEQSFIMERDSFYQATIAENGWPYVQHRGGPAGFIKVLGEKTIGYADFSGNRQYLSVGNLIGDARISLILMNYPQRQRLKIWGRARIVDESIEPELIAKLESESYRAPVERGIVIEVEALDWNCPKYITPRFTQQEVEQYWVKEADDVEKAEHIGRGSIPLRITAVKQLTPEIMSYELSHTDGERLPNYKAGAHITVPVELMNGSYTTRSYSLTQTSGKSDNYHIAVKLDRNGQGASVAIHKTWHVGKRINIEVPENYFILHDDKRSAVLIAGGIGITPIKAMAEELSLSKVPFQLHYSVKSAKQLAFRDELMSQFKQQSHFYYSQDVLSQKLDISRVVENADKDAVFYVCGPTELIQNTIKIASELGIARERINYESFQ